MSLLSETVVPVDPAAMTLRQFLEAVAPGEPVSSGVVQGIKAGAGYKELAKPPLQLHCTSQECHGITWFDHKEGSFLIEATWGSGILRYVCRHCQKTGKLYALWARIDGATVSIQKIGESPRFGPPLPSRVAALVGSDVELFKRGFRAEHDGLGMGASVYYRRVVDNQRARIFEQVVEAAKAANASPQQIKKLEAAKTANRAIEDVNDAVPDSLLIGGQNPLTLLYKTLSEDIHEYSDEECLQSAKDVRSVLTELADRIALVTENKDEVNSAVQRLLDRKNKAKGEPKLAL